MMIRSFTKVTIPASIIRKKGVCCVIVMPMQKSGFGGAGATEYSYLNLKTAHGYHHGHILATASSHGTFR